MTERFLAHQRPFFVLLAICGFDTTASEERCFLFDFLKSNIRDQLCCDEQNSHLISPCLWRHRIYSRQIKLWILRSSLNTTRQIMIVFNLTTFVRSCLARQLLGYFFHIWGKLTTPLNQPVLQVLWTLFSEYFALFDHSTCALSDSCWIFRISRSAPRKVKLHSQTTIHLDTVRSLFLGPRNRDAWVFGD